MNDKTTENLQSELKAIKIIAGALVLVLTLLLVISIYGLVAKDNNATFIALIAVAITCSATLPLQFINIKKIRTELSKRSANEQKQI